MKLFTKATLAILSLTILSCGVPQKEHDKALAEIETLKTNLDNCENGAEKLAAQAEDAFNSKDYALSKEKILLLYTRHPESTRKKEFAALLTQIEEIETQDSIKQEHEEKERIRLANYNNTGIWENGFYVDDFGEPTKDAYIKNRDLIKGLFSNTATQNSNLNVKFLITNSNDISIQLYEYARNNPVKGHSGEEYYVQIQDKNGNRSRLIANNYHDRLSFGKKDSEIIHKALIIGGQIKFKITEEDTPTTEYRFDIENATYYDNAFRKLKES